MKKVLIVCLSAIWLLTSCALMPAKTGDYYTDTNAMLDSMDLSYGMLKAGFDTLCVEKVVDEKTCLSGKVAYSTWDNNFTITKDLLMQYQAGKIEQTTANQAVASLLKIGIDMVRIFNGAQEKAMKTIQLQLRELRIIQRNILNKPSGQK